MLIGQEGWLAPAFHAEDYSMSTRQGPLDMTHKIKFYFSRKRRSAFAIALLVCVAFAVYFGVHANAARFFIKGFARVTHRRQLSFAERVSYQRAIEEVYWRHRIWPA